MLWLFITIVGSSCCSCCRVVGEVEFRYRVVACLLFVRKVGRACMCVKSKERKEKESKLRRDSRESIK